MDGILMRENAPTWRAKVVCNAIGVLMPMRSTASPTPEGAFTIQRMAVLMCSRAASRRAKV